MPETIEHGDIDDDDAYSEGDTPPEAIDFAAAAEVKALFDDVHDPNTDTTPVAALSALYGDDLTVI